MKAGLVADIIVAIVILINLVVCTHKGFIRCVIASVSNVLSFAVAIFAAAPLANLLESRFGWQTAIESWHLPLFSAQTLLRLLVGVGVFVVARLLFIILDLILKVVKKKLKAVNAIDRILGTVFGAVVALTTLTIVFLAIHQIGWVEKLSLTPMVPLPGTVQVFCPA